MLRGTLVADKYRIEGPLGSGGMASVFLAVHEGLDQRVALKLMSPTEAPGAVERFRREAQIVARLRGEHVARAIDFGSLPSGELYLVLEYLDGKDLSRVLRDGPLPVPVAVGYALHVCEALAEAHAAGLVHRDIKPGNLFLAARPDGTALVKVLDFGIARPLESLGPRRDEITATGVVIATVNYASPEQLVSSKHVGAATDQFSLAAALYEMLTGARAFPGEVAVAMTAVLKGRTPMVSEALPSAPAGLSEVVARALAKRPEERFASVAELARALVPYAPPDYGVHAERASRLLNEELLRASVPSVHTPSAGSAGAHDPARVLAASGPGNVGAPSSARMPLPSSPPPSGTSGAPSSARVGLPSSPPGSAHASVASNAPPPNGPSGPPLAGPSTASPTSRSTGETSVSSRPSGLLSLVYLVGAAFVIILVMVVVRKATKREPAPAAEAPVFVPTPVLETKAPAFEPDPLVPEPATPMYVGAFDAAAPPTALPDFCHGPKAKLDKRYKKECANRSSSSLDAAIKSSDWPTVKAILLPRASELGCGELQTLKTACRETGDACAKTVGALRLDKHCL